MGVLGLSEWSSEAGLLTILSRRQYRIDQAIICNLNTVSWIDAFLQLHLIVEERGFTLELEPIHCGRETVVHRLERRVALTWFH